MMEEDPYQPPAGGVEVEKSCPACGELMERGKFFSHSALRWMPDGESAVKKFLTGGELIRGRGKSFQIQASNQQEAWRCRGCELFVLIR